MSAQIPDAHILAAEVMLKYGQAIDDQKELTPGFFNDDRMQRVIAALIALTYNEQLRYKNVNKVKFEPQDQYVPVVVDTLTLAYLVLFGVKKFIGLHYAETHQTIQMIQFADCKIYNSNFATCTFHGCIFTNTTIADTDMSDTAFTHCKFTDARLMNVQFNQAVLEDCQYDRVDFDWCCLVGTEMTPTKTCTFDSCDVRHNSAFFAWSAAGENKQPGIAFVVENQLMVYGDDFGPHPVSVVEMFENLADYANRRLPGHRANSEDMKRYTQQYINLLLIAVSVLFDNDAHLRITRETLMAMVK